MPRSFKVYVDSNQVVVDIEIDGEEHPSLDNILDCIGQNFSEVYEHVGGKFHGNIVERAIDRDGATVDVHEYTEGLWYLH